MLEQLAPVIPRASYLPILMLTGDSSIPSKKRALSLGAKDFVTKPFDVHEPVGGGCHCPRRAAPLHDVGAEILAGGRSSLIQMASIPGWWKPSGVCPTRS